MKERSQKRVKNEVKATKEKSEREGVCILEKKEYETERE